jgi:putative transposase
MNVENIACASSAAVEHWDQIDWKRCERQVARLQARVVKASQMGRRSKVKALQRLFTCSFSGKALAVARVTESKGKRPSFSRCEAVASSVASHKMHCIINEPAVALGMAIGRPLRALKLSADETIAVGQFCLLTQPAAFSGRPRSVEFWTVEGVPNQEIGSRLNWSNPTVGEWRQRFVEHRIAGLYDELRPGRPRSVSDEQVAVLLRRTLKQKPPVGTHWTVRMAAETNRLSKSSVHRVFQLFALQPHRSKSFKLSTDPFFVEKVRDVVGLYLNPPDHALVLSVDEKSQIQALNRTQPVLPMGLGFVEGVTHDYVRNGTTPLFAGLDIASGTVLTDCKPRHRHQEFLGFLKRIDEAVPTELDVHLIVDNYATHKHAKVRTWLASRPHFHLHFTPTYSSWLNQVER